jgi:hypothetical protein
MISPAAILIKFLIFTLESREQEEESDISPITRKPMDSPTMPWHFRIQDYEKNKPLE